VSDLASVRVTVTVAVTPADAFEVFTAEFDQWYRTGTASLGRRARPGTTMRFEPGVGGRLLECRPGQPPVERARITVWRPGERLVFVDRRDTEVDVLFAAVAEGTRVVLEHRGLDRLPPGQAADIARYGWRRLPDWFEQHLDRRTPP
jgi:hypothetical protein